MIKSMVITKSIMLKLKDHNLKLIKVRFTRYFSAPARKAAAHSLGCCP